MAAKKKQKQNPFNRVPAKPKRRSKRERRMRIAIYIMIIAMVLSSLSYGLVMFL